MHEQYQDGIKKMRTEEVRVKCTPEMKKRIDRIAELHGMPPSTWAAMAVATAVVEFERKYQIQNKTAEQMAKNMQELLGPMFQKLFDDQQLLEAREQEAGGTQAGE